MHCCRDGWVKVWQGAAMLTSSASVVAGLWKWPLLHPGPVVPLSGAKVIGPFKFSHLRTEVATVEAEHIPNVSLEGPFCICCRWNFINRGLVTRFAASGIENRCRTSECLSCDLWPTVEGLPFDAKIIKSQRMLVFGVIARNCSNDLSVVSARFSKFCSHTNAAKMPCAYGGKRHSHSWCGKMSSKDAWLTDDCILRRSWNAVTPSEISLLATSAYRLVRYYPVSLCFYFW